MILAAGLGTRLKPFTDLHPKALGVVNGKTVLQRNVEYLLAAGIQNIVVNVHHFADQVIDAIETNKGWGASISISNESEELLDTGGGIKKAVPLFGEAENIVVMNADVLTDMNLLSMMDYHNDTGATATLAVSNRNSSRGFLFDKSNRLCGWQNSNTGEVRQPVKADEVIAKSFSGIHILHESLFRHLPFSGTFSIVDVYLTMCTTYLITGFDHSGSKFIDIGTMEKLEAASAIFH